MTCTPEHCSRLRARPDFLSYLMKPQRRAIGTLDLADAKPGDRGGKGLHQLVIVRRHTQGVNRQVRRRGSVLPKQRNRLVPNAGNEKETSGTHAIFSA